MNRREHRKHGAWRLKTLLRQQVLERPLQTHLEKHPWLITGHHLPDENLVISQFDLGGQHRTDFAYFWHHSGGEFLQLVEIERSAMPVFTKHDQFRSEFNHALLQISDWPDWFNRYSDKVHACLEPLFDNGWLTGIPTYRQVKVTLIAGRRNDVLANERRRIRWQKKVNDLATLGAELRTWDGFLASIPATSFLNRINWRYLRCIRYSEACRHGPDM